MRPAFTVDPLAYALFVATVVAWVIGEARRFVRHPSYAGFLLALAGVGVSFGNWLSLIALLVSAALGFIYRIRVEEAALSAALGERYDNYAAGRKRLIPLVW